MSLSIQNDGGRTALDSLRRYLQPRAIARSRCELCGAALAEDHAHLVELTSRRLSCACDACAILFSNAGVASDRAGGGLQYRRVPKRVQLLVDFRLGDLQWEALQLPINLAFFMYNSAEGRVVAFYPSPAGATEALPPPDAWEALVQDNPGLADLQPDVEALLINRLGAEPEHYRVGIDECYALVGVVRTHWRGLSGGTKVWAEITTFFQSLRNRGRRTEIR